MEMDVNVRSSSQELQREADLSPDLFEGSDGECGSIASDVDIFDQWEGEDDAVQPIGDVAVEPMEIDEPQPGPSTLRFQQPSTSREGEPPAKVPRTSEEEKMAKTLAQLRAASDNGMRNFGHYMQLKKDKLRYQVNVVSRVDAVVSDIFQGVSIFVNGHTDPSALELRELIQSHGGDYHCYMEYGTTTYTIASSLAAAKVDKTRKNEVFLLPGWIVDCIAAGERLPIDGYRLMAEEKEKNAPITNFFAPRGTDTPVPEEREKALDARDPNFIQEFYARSRLHLISTLAQDMKDFMTILRETGHFTTEEWDRVGLTREDTSISEPLVFHIDLDSFFVSVALRERPELKDRPVAITHSRGSASAPGFSEVASVSYAARRLGMKNGMLVRDALKLCPSLICLPYQFDDYRAVSKSIYTLISKFTLDVRAVSCDEMYVNFTQSCSDRKIADVVGLANHIRARIREETGCPASVGIGPNMLLARLSTRKAKPDGVHWTRKKDAVKFIAEEKIENIPGIGYMTLQKLRERFGELELCGDLQNVEVAELEALFGKKSGHHIYQQCRGEDDSLRDFLASGERKSVSCDINYGIRFTQREEVTDFLGRVAEEVCKKLNGCRRVSGSVTLKLMIRSPNAPVETAKYLGHGRCDTVTKTGLIGRNTDDPDRLLKEILLLYDAIRPVVEDLRGIGVHCGRLVPADSGVRRLQVMKNFFDPKGRAPLKEKSPVEPKRNEEVEKPQTEVEDAMEMPKLNGAATPADTRLQLKALLGEVPTELSIRLLSKFLHALNRYGAYSSIRAYTIYLSRLLSEPTTSSEWTEPLQAIFARLDQSIHWYFGGKFIEKELRKNPLTSTGC